MNSTEALKAICWLMGGDTGISSETILAVMVGAPFHGAGVPHDADDFGRCHRLLQRFPEWRARLGEVAERYPIWGPLVREWDALTDLYGGSHRAMYDRLQALIDEGRLAAGWTQTAPGCWRGPCGKPTVVTLRAKP
jgi:hypothetical protein